MGIRPEGLRGGGFTPRSVQATPRPKTDLEPLLAAGVVLITLLMWRLWTYGAWLPNTAAARRPESLPTSYKSTKNTSKRWYWVGWLLFTAMVPPSVGGIENGVVGCLIVGSIAVASQVYLWMPGGRLLLTPMALGFVLMCQPLARPGPFAKLTWGLLLVACVAVGMSPLRDRLERQDAIHSVVKDNPAMMAARHLAAHAPEGAWLGTRDAGVLAYGVGTGIRVGELHPRALTQRHVQGADADPSQYLPENPAFFIFTSNRLNKKNLYYSLERRVFSQTTARYRYLGRVEQHHNRYYDVVVRDDIEIPPIPKEWVTNFALELPLNQAR